MTLKEHYRVHNKAKSNKLLIVYIIILGFYIFSTSFSRYTSESITAASLELADWCIKINETEITKDTTIIRNEIDLVVTDNATPDGLIKPGQKGYFDIVIDPQYTEVSLKYAITLNTSELPSEIKLTQFYVNDISTLTNVPVNNKLTGRILLNGKSNLEDTDKKTFRVFWKWDAEDAVMESIQSTYKIKANVQIEQLIED